MCCPCWPPRSRPSRTRGEGEGGVSLSRVCAFLYHCCAVPCLVRGKSKRDKAIGRTRVWKLHPGRWTTTTHPSRAKSRQLPLSLPWTHSAGHLHTRSTTRALAPLAFDAHIEPSHLPLPLSPPPSLLPTHPLAPPPPPSPLPPLPRLSLQPHTPHQQTPTQATWATSPQRTRRLDSAPDRPRRRTAPPPHPRPTRRLIRGTLEAAPVRVTRLRRRTRQTMVAGLHQEEEGEGEGEGAGAHPRRAPSTSRRVGAARRRRRRRRCLARRRRIRAEQAQEQEQGV